MLDFGCLVSLRINIHEQLFLLLCIIMKYNTNNIHGYTLYRVKTQYMFQKYFLMKLTLPIIRQKKHTIQLSRHFKKITTVDPWKTWIWTRQVHMWMFFNLLQIKYTIFLDVKSIYMEGWIFIYTHWAGLIARLEYAWVWEYEELLEAILHLHTKEQLYNWPWSPKIQDEARPIF